MPAAGYVSVNLKQWHRGLSNAVLDVVALQLYLAEIWIREPFLLGEIGRRACLFVTCADVGRIAFF